MIDPLGFDVSDNCVVLRETPRALLVRIPFMNNGQFWVPKSQITPESEVFAYRHLGDRRPGGKGALIVRKWWAMKNGLHPRSPHFRLEESELGRMR